MARRSMRPPAASPEEARIDAEIARRERAAEDVVARQALRFELAKSALAGVATQFPMPPLDAGYAPDQARSCARWAAMLADATLAELESRP